MNSKESESSRTVFYFPALSSLSGTLVVAQQLDACHLIRKSWAHILPGNDLLITFLYFIFPFSKSRVSIIRSFNEVSLIEKSMLSCTGKTGSISTEAHYRI